MSLIVPGVSATSDEKVPVPPWAFRVPIPMVTPAATPQLTLPVDGLAGSVGHQSMKCIVLLPFANVSTPAEGVPKPPVMLAAPATAQNVNVMATHARTFMQPERRTLLM